MKTYIVVNKTTDDIQLMIPAPYGSTKQHACLILPGAGSIDILPYAGSVENCKLVAFIHDLEIRGMVQVVQHE